MTMINEKRLFKFLPHFFEKPEGVLIEIAQNALRAGATKLDISLHDNQLYARDNGAGTMNPASLVTLSDSGWDSDVEENQMPAGWGLFMLFSLCEAVEFRSLFGDMYIVCEDFLNNDQKKRARKPLASAMG